MNAPVVMRNRVSDDLTDIADGLVADLAADAPERRETIVRMEADCLERDWDRLDILVKQLVRIDPDQVRGIMQSAIEDELARREELKLDAHRGLDTDDSAHNDPRHVPYANLGRR